MSFRFTRCAMAVAVASSAAMAVGVTHAAAAFPNISAVSFAGAGGHGQPSPTVTVRGSDFGTEPAGTPDTACGGTGDIFGKQFYFVDSTRRWQAGASYRTNTNCIGITVQSWTTTRVIFKFGSEYNCCFPSWTLKNGDNFAVVLKTYAYGGEVGGLAQMEDS